MRTIYLYLLCQSKNVHARKEHKMSVNFTNSLLHTFNQYGKKLHEIMKH